jgi:predicted nicotinamide N-methyase
MHAVVVTCLLNPLSNDRLLVLEALQPPTRPSSRPSSPITDTTTVRGLPVHRVPLRQSSPSSPYCLAVSSIANLPPKCNFLATQVWPSARVAARALEQHAPNVAPSAVADAALTVCELGCGPGLPSLTAATLRHNVVATDVEELALDLVRAAATEQGVGDRIVTRKVDLVDMGSTCWEDDDDWIKAVDLFVMSDVFECEAVAIGAARLTQKVLSSSSRNKVWVFAQSDRAQREVYLKELKRIFPSSASLGWCTYDQYNPQDRLWLCDLDETRVDYG